MERRRVSYRLCSMLIWFVGCVHSALAQEVIPLDSLSQVSVAEAGSIPAMPAEGAFHQRYAGSPVPDIEGVLPTDSVPALPSFDIPPLRADGTIGYFPDFYYGTGLGIWNLHEGFNANLNMSVCASFGKHRFPGVGFGTGISAMYAHQLTDKLMIAAGGFYDRMSWGAYNDNRLGLNLMLGYQLSEKVSVYAYGSKAFTPSSGRMRMMLPMFWMDRYKERFGGMIHVKVSDAMSFSVSVEERRW